MDLQTRSAVVVAEFIDFCVRHNITQPPDKIVKNLCTFLCQDVEQTPTFSYNRLITEGILSFQAATNPMGARQTNEATRIKEADKGPLDDEVAKSRLSRRGACLAFEKLSVKFGPTLLDSVPTMWQSMAGGLLSALQTGEWQ